jgi:hypothetical protein
MILLIKIPTKGRIKFLGLLDLYYTMCDDLENTHFLITLDNDDVIMNQPDVIENLKQRKNLTYVYGVSDSKIGAINRDIDLVDEWDILLLSSDDMVPKIQGYDNIIRNNMVTHYPNTDGVLWFNDGFQGKKLNTLPILGKNYFNRFNYIYHSDYKSLWCDNEFTEVANILGKQTYFNDVIIKHEHPAFGYGDKDALYLENDTYDAYDKLIYNKRKMVNFNL